MKTNHKVPDSGIEDLIGRCRYNDRRAQLLLYERFAGSMYNTSFRLVKNSAEAEDIVQEAFLSAFRALDTYRGKVPFDAWLRRIVINRSLDYLRSTKQLFAELKDNDKVSDEALPYFVEEDDTQRKKRLDMIKEEAMALPDGYRIVFSLYYYEGYDHEEISDILNISASASRSQLSRAKNRVIRALKNRVK